jgi:regulator of protease activity HflC (stomatin/prohibitin superfamily)
MQAIKKQVEGKTIHELIKRLNLFYNKLNLSVGICNSGNKVVVQRFGKYNRTIDPGIYLAIPLIEETILVDTRDATIEIPGQFGTTIDNVTIRIDGNLFFRISDPQKALYCAKNPIELLVYHAYSSMRTTIGEMTFDDMFHARKKINDRIRISITESASKWGIDVSAYEIANITADSEIMKAMDLQAIAERQRREKVKNADGDKETMIILSEARRNAAENDAIALLTAERAKAEALQIRYSNQALGIKLLLDAGVQAKDIPDTMFMNDKIDALKQFASKGTNTIFAPTPDIAGMLGLGAMAKKTQ